MKRIGIVAALAGELQPLVQGWQRTALRNGASFTQTRNGVETVAVHCGMGREPAARACMRAMEDGPLAALVSIGWAGALSPNMQIGRACSVTEVVDAATGERYRTEDHAGAAETITLVTAKRVVLRKEKRRLAEDFAANLVDMEAATVARLARVREVPFYCYKAVSDGMDESLPDMNPYIARDGSMNIPAFVASVLVRPQYWPALVRMGRNGKLGAEALAGAVDRLRREIENAHGD